jgi:hypothetical protein
MIVEITHEEIDRALKKRIRNGDKGSNPDKWQNQENLAYGVEVLL